MACAGGRGQDLLVENRRFCAGFKRGWVQARKLQSRANLARTGARSICSLPPVVQNLTFHGGHRPRGLSMGKELPRKSRYKIAFLGKLSGRAKNWRDLRRSCFCSGKQLFLQVRAPEQESVKVTLQGIIHTSHTASYLHPHLQLSCPSYQQCTYPPGFPASPESNQFPALPVPICVIPYTCFHREPPKNLVQFSSPAIPLGRRFWLQLSGRHQSVWDHQTVAISSTCCDLFLILTLNPSRFITSFISNAPLFLHLFSNWTAAFWGRDHSLRRILTTVHSNTNTKIMVRNFPMELFFSPVERAEQFTFGGNLLVLANLLMELRQKPTAGRLWHGLVCCQHSSAQLLSGKPCFSRACEYRPGQLSGRWSDGGGFVSGAPTFKESI